MRNEFTAVVGQDGGRFITYSPEIPGANGLSVLPDHSGPGPTTSGMP